MSLKRLHTIARDHYLTGQHRDHRILMCEHTWIKLLEKFTDERPTTLWPQVKIGHMMSIPVLVDERLNSGQWQLVDSNGNVLETGTVDEETNDGQ